MNPKIVIIIEDDCELNGNGTGNVADAQYLPATFLMNLARKYGFKISFMVEVLQQIAFRKHQQRSGQLRIQADLWDGLVRQMIHEGHDVQPHFHPQWLNANYDNGHFLLGRNWNIATYPRDQRVDIIANSLDYLKNLLRPIDPQYTPHSVKAGSWALQPSQHVLEDLQNAGIKLVLGVGLGIHLESSEFHVDYRDLDSPVLPYYPDFQDIRRISTSHKDIAVIPLAYYRLRVRDIAARVFQNVRWRCCPKEELHDYMDGPQIARKPSPLGNQMRFKRLRPLDIAANPFGELKTAIDSIISRVSRLDCDYVPVVLQSHTKRYRRNWKNLARFFEYLTERYHSRVEFATLSEILPHLNSAIVPGRADA